MCMPQTATGAARTEGPCPREALAGVPVRRRQGSIAAPADHFHRMTDLFAGNF